jgi:type VI secretion system protein ImpB
MAVNKKIPQSRLMIRYDTRVDGELVKKELPFKLLVLGDYSNGLSKDAKEPLEKRQPRDMNQGIDQLILSMGISIPIKVCNVINPSKSATIEIDYPFKSMKDLTPDSISKALPNTAILRKLRKVLVSFEKEMDNNLSMRKMIDGVLSSEEKRVALTSKLSMLNTYALSMMSEATLQEEKNFNAPVPE